MRPEALVRKIRSDARLSLRELAEAAGMATSTVHRIEQGDLRPTVDTLERIVEAAGARLVVEAEIDSTASMVGLARTIEVMLTDAKDGGPVRLAAEFASRFRARNPARRTRMISAEPPTTGDERWDAFLAALAEWLAVEAGMACPAWAARDGRFLHRGWWVTPMHSMRAWEYAGSPVSFQIRGVYVHRESLVNV